MCISRKETMSFEIHTELPKQLLIDLEDRNARIRKECKIWIVELSSEESQSYFRDFLEAPDDDEVDPVVQVTFGPPMNPYISPAMQVEVWSVISIYLLKNNFLPGATPAGGIQYHHTKIALQKVQDEIEHPDWVAESIPLLQGMDSGIVICDFTMVYANCVVVRRLYRR